VEKDLVERFCLDGILDVSHFLSVQLVIVDFAGVKS
jgi:hypothetical protein